MPFKKGKLHPLSVISTAASITVCYGTLGIVALLGLTGTTVNINTSLWATTIVGFAFLATLGLVAGLKRHHKPWPLLMGVLGTTMIGYVMFIDYNLFTEISGFVLLGIAAIWDWRICHAPVENTKKPGHKDRVFKW